MALESQHETQFSQELKSYSFDIKPIYTQKKLIKYKNTIAIAIAYLRKKVTAKDPSKKGNSPVNSCVSYIMNHSNAPTI